MDGLLAAALGQALLDPIYGVLRAAGEEALTPSGAVPAGEGTMSSALFGVDLSSSPPTLLPSSQPSPPVVVTTKSTGARAVAAALSYVDQSMDFGDGGVVPSYVSVDLNPAGQSETLLRSSATAIPTSPTIVSTSAGNGWPTAPIPAPIVKTALETTTPGLPGSTTPTTNNLNSAVTEVTADPPPNEAPVANDDTATVNEDSSVVIDVLGNDTDADGDTLFVDDWDPTPSNGLVLRRDDGSLEYRPGPNFNGQDTFSYTVSDGMATTSATVTVTVNPVNDVPVAFNDAYSWPLDMPDDPGGLGASAENGLLANDVDYDFDQPTGTIQVASVDTSGMIGSVSVDSDGAFTFHFPWPGFTGQTSFRYTLTDGVAESAPATALIFVLPPSDGTTPPASVETYTYAVGEDPINDAVPGIAVLDGSPPANGRLTSFNLDGSFTYEPPKTGPVGEEPKIKVYSQDGILIIKGTIIFVPVTLDIKNGQNSSRQLSFLEQKMVGAYTVANLNDTDGDGVIDALDDYVGWSEVPIEPGTPEVDLMKLVVNKPNDPNNQGQKVKLTVSGSAALWLYSVKMTPVALDAGGAVEFNLADLPKTLWVEVYAPSQALRDVSIKMEYKATGQLFTAKDTVYATGIWVWKDSFRNSGNSLSPQADGKEIQETFKKAMGSVLGTGLETLPNGAQRVTSRNGMEIGFVIQPFPIDARQILFDISRTMQGRVWETLPNQPRHEVIGMRRDWRADGFRDIPNDDISSTDEDNIPSEIPAAQVGLIYVVDGPGWAIGVAPLPGQRIEQRGNFVEFVRVKIDAGRFTHPAVLEGSRASQLVEWYTRMDIQEDPNTHWWKRGLNNAENKIEEGYQALGN
jgi:Bacterial Ig domain